MSPTLRPKSPITRPHTHAEMVVVCDDDEDDWLLIEDAWTHVAPNVELRYTQDRQALLDLLTTMATQDDTFPALVQPCFLNAWISTSSSCVNIRQGFLSSPAGQC
jgi:hypothetical protein